MALKRLLVLCVLALTALLASAAPTPTTEANVPVEIVFHGVKSHGDPFNEVTLDVVFTDPTGAKFRVPAFWDGGSVWKVRYASPKTGLHRFVTDCSDRSDKGLNGIAGSVKITAYTGANPLFRHGPVRVDSDERHLDYGDGTPFFWLGDTWWMGLAQRLHYPDEFAALTQDRVSKGFTVVQIVAGLYPDMLPFDKRGANEAGFPWESNYARINPAYFDRADERIRYLVDHGLSPCIVGAWGYFATWMSEDKLKQHWRYLIARYGAMPVVWCGAGEANLPWYLAKGFPIVEPEQVLKWTAVVRYIHKTDPFHRPVTVHPTAVSSYSSRYAIDDPGILDFDMLQTPHGELSAAEVALAQVRASRVALPQMPVIDGEAAYEMLGDSLPTEWTRAMFWLCMTNGAAGHTYGANGIWQNNRPGDPHGKSPHGAFYGKISSQEAMHLPGSSEVGFGKRLFEKYPWYRFVPHPEWTIFQANERATLKGSHWIWFPEGDPRQDAPVGVRYFRAGIVLPVGRSIVDARLLLSADDAATVYLNGEKVGESSDWHSGLVIDGLEKRLKLGLNVIAVRAENRTAPVQKNPAGLVVTFEVRYRDGSTRVVRTDGSWRVSQSAPEGWTANFFNDRAWSMAMVLGPFGSAPWGYVGSADSAISPQSIGIEGGVRIVYVIRSAAIVERFLDPAVSYSAKYFDPVTGQESPAGEVAVSPVGKATFLPPKECKHDWVLVLEPRS